MSDQTKVDVSQQAYAAFGRGDTPALLSFLSEDGEWSLPGPSAIPWAGTCHGHEGVAEFFPLVDETLEFEQFEVREFVGQGNPVVLGYERSFLKPTGRTLEQEQAHGYALRNGRIAKGRFFRKHGGTGCGFWRRLSPAPFGPSQPLNFREALSSGSSAFEDTSFIGIPVNRGNGTSLP